MVYLCGRAIGDGYIILGRETALDPVTWTTDGWPIVNNLKGPSAMQVKPFKDCTSVGRNGISECGLPLEYMTPRPFKEGDILYDKETGTFSVMGSGAPLSSVESRNIVLRRQTDFSFDYEVTLVIPKMSEGQSAGITGYYDENTFLEFGITCRGGVLFLYANEHIGDEDRCEMSEKAIAADTKSIRLKMYTNYFERKLSYSTDADCDEKLFTVLSNVYYLCDEDLSRGKRFTGALVGMYAYAGKEELVASFSGEMYSKVCHGDGSFGMFPIFSSM